MKRSGYLARHVPLTGGGALRPVGRTGAKAKAAFAKAYHSRAYRAWVLMQGCVCRGKWPDCGGPMEASHVRSRGAGGTWRDLVGMTRNCHAAWHQTTKWLTATGWTFDTLLKYARALARRWEKR